jgi:hypothetical protein
MIDRRDVLRGLAALPLLGGNTGTNAVQVDRPTMRCE